MSYLLMKSITKTFPGVIANDKIDLEVAQGSIHALLGENGAGKSTLMKILYGIYTPEEGKIFFNGQEIRVPNPRAAIRLGIGMVHQEFHLVPSLTVSENIALGYELIRNGLVDRKAQRRRIAEIIEHFGFKLPLEKPIAELPVGVQQQVEIIKLLYRKAEILILDEPTSVLTPQEVDNLFGVLQNLREQGKTIIYITHKLREVKKICDFATILRRGRVVGRVRVADVTERELANLMVGEQVIDYIFPRSGQVGEKKLVLERVSAIDDRGILALKEVTFTVNAGEIVGVAGVQGSGQSELVEVISGLIHPAKGKIWLNGKDITRASPRQRREIGLAIIPEKRKEQGLNLNTNVVENVISTRYYKSPFSRWLTLFDRPAEKFAQRIVSEFSITMSSLKSKVENLSGGNQQKVIVGREMIEQPDVLIAAYPTRGLDVSAAQFVRETMIRRRDQGGAILLISADLDELFAVSDRILILYEGQIVGETKPDETSFEKVGLLMTGHFHAS